METPDMVFVRNPPVLILLIVTIYVRPQNLEHRKISIRDLRQLKIMKCQILLLIQHLILLRTGWWEINIRFHVNNGSRYVYIPEIQKLWKNQNTDARKERIDFPILSFKILILCVFLVGNYSPKYLLSRPANAFPCLASSLAIS